MAKTKLSIDRGRDIFLHRTKVENLFISEYLPDAPGDYVKVFLFGLMYAQYEIKPDRSELAKLLGLSVEEIAEIMHTTPENIREIQQKKVIVFEKNVVPEELH